MILMTLYGTPAEIRRRMKQGSLDIYLVGIIIFSGYDYGTDTIFITLFFISTLPNRFMAEYLEVEDFIETLELRTIHRVLKEFCNVPLEQEVSEKAYQRSEEAHLEVKVPGANKVINRAGVKVEDN